MRIAFYHEYGCLPSAPEPQQPDLVFDPEVHGTWITTPAWGSKGQLVGHPATECIFWPFLMGIVELDLPLLAHVSMNFTDGQLAMNERIWTAFTSLPEGDNPVPQVVDANGAFKVMLLWSQGNPTTSPWGLRAARRVRESRRMDSAFWTGLFLAILREEKQRQEGRIIDGIRRLAEAQRIWLQIP